MTQKIAVAMIHGIGKQKQDFAQQSINMLNKQFEKQCVKGDLVMDAVYWAYPLQDEENDLYKRIKPKKAGLFEGGRRLLVDFVGDAFAYQITRKDRDAYNQIHGVFAETLKGLAQKAGNTAPLCIIAHSLGSIIASNYIYDLQFDSAEKRLIPPMPREIMGEKPSPLESGETLALFYTMGSPIAIWSLRYPDFGLPITIPDARIGKYHKRFKGEWVNFYDRDDLIGSRLRALNPQYHNAVKEDKEVNVGNAAESWNPASHLAYWNSDAVMNRIADKLIKVWKAVNP